MDAIRRFRTTEEKIEVTQEAIAQRVAPARILTDLAEEPGWIHLRTTFEEKRLEYEASLIRSVMEGQILDQRLVDYNRGFFKGLQQLLAAPERAQELLENALKKLERLSSNQTEEDEEEVSE